MLQIATFRDETNALVAGLKKRDFADAEQLVEQVLALDQQRRDTQTELDQLQARSNLVSKQIGQLMQAGKKEQAEAAKQQTAQFKVESKELQSRLIQVTQDLNLVLYQIPNLPHHSVPEGKGASDNLVIKEGGQMPDLDENKQPHWELVKKYDLIDFDLGNKVTGAGFPFYKGAGARLQRALVNFFLDQALAAGYYEVQPPILVNQDSGYATGQLPDKEGQMYPIEGESLYLIPTAEVPITNMYRDVLLKEQQFPIKMVAFTPCFRREAGSWGAHVRGLNRLHQFDKVELVHIEKPENSYKVHKQMCAYVEGLLQQLGLPYRILNLCTGDLGFTSALTYDFEVFSAGQERWLEVSSVSNFETFQANRMKLRFKDTSGNTHLAHTLNGSALALPRVLAALLENNQQENFIKIPEKLVPYTKFDHISLTD